MNASLRTIISILAVAALCGIAISEDWQLYTDTRDIRDIALADGKLWLATSGGLVKFDPADRSFQTFTSLDDLGGVGVKSVLLGREGELWVVNENRQIQAVGTSGEIQHRIPALAMQEGISSVNCLDQNARALYVGTSRGIAVVTYNPSLDEWFWFEEIRKLGSFSADLPVVDLLATDRYLWVATTEGIACADLDTPAPYSWRNFTTDTGLPHNNVRDLHLNEGTVWAATAFGVARLNPDTTWSWVTGRADLYRLFSHEDTLCIIASDGASRRDGANWIRYGEMQLASAVGVWDDGSGLWLGMKRNGVGAGGLAHFDGNAWESIIPSSPPTNYALTAQFEPDGAMYLAGGTGAGAYGLGRLADGLWTSATSPRVLGGPFNFLNTCIALDRAGSVWVMTSGGGAARYLRSDSIMFYDSRPETGGRLRGIPGASGTVVMGEAVTDHAGNVWMLNTGADDHRVLVCVPSSFTENLADSSAWLYFSASQFGDFDQHRILTVDERDRVWIASDNTSTGLAGTQGVYVFDPNSTPGNPADDHVYGPLTGLPTNIVYDLCYDPAGYMWAGTPRGVYYAQLNVTSPAGYSFTEVYSMRDITTRSIDVDPAGNKWFATDFGVMILSGVDLFSIIRRINSTPPDLLPSDAVQFVKVNPYTGWALMGTRDGTAMLRTPYRDYGRTLTSLTFGPNPFNPEKGRLFFQGTSLAGGASVTILSPDGRKVRKLSHEEAAMGWDGLDDAGQSISSGVYLIVAANSEGQAATGKLAVLRK